MSDPTAPIETYRGVVYPWQCDHVGHMNVTYYVAKFDEGTWNLMAALGVTAAYLRDNDRGVAAVQQNLTYRRELMVGETVRVTSRVLELRGKVVRFLHEMFTTETGELAASCEITGVHLDRTTRKSVPFPDAIAERARALLPADAGDDAAQ